MTEQEVNSIIMMNGSKLPFEGIEMLRQKLLGMDYATATVYMAQMKDPTIAIILSVLIGELGIDRFYIGDIGLGVLKLITCGGLGIWWIIDIILIMNLTRQKNMETIMTM